MNYLGPVYAAFSPRPYSRPVILSMNELQVGERLDHFCIESLAAQSGMAAFIARRTCGTAGSWR